MATIQTDPITHIILQGRKNPDGKQHFYPHAVDGGSTVTVTVEAGQVSMQTETNNVTGNTANPAPVTTPPVTTPPVTTPPVITPPVTTPPVTTPPVTTPPTPSGTPPTVASMSDGPWYLSTYPDVAAAKLDPLWHYANYGYKEGRHPGPKFNTLKYLAAYPDVTGNALLDYVNTGYAKGRQAFPVLAGDPLIRPYVPPVPTPTPAPTITGPAAVTWPAGTRPPKFTGIRVVQPYPVGPDSKFNTFIGWAEPVGGIGPWGAAIVPNHDGNGNYRMTNGLIAISGQAPLGTSVDVVRIQMTDGRGDTCTQDFTVQKTAENVSGLALNTPNPSVALSPLVNGTPRFDIAPTFTPVAYGPTHGDVRGDRIAVWVQGQELKTPHPVWASGGGQIYGRSGCPAAGEYPVTITATNPSTNDMQLLNTTLKLGPPPNPLVGYIEFNQTMPISTATSVGEVIGFVAAETPTDGAGGNYTITDPTGTLYVDSGSRQVIVVKTPEKSGPITFKLTNVVDSGLGSGSQDYTVNVLQGQVLDAALMTLPVNPNLDNSTPAQVIGTATVKGVTGGWWRVAKQNNFNTDATTGWWGTPGRYQVDNTGRVFTAWNCLLSYQNPAYGYQQDQITLVWTSDDGTRTCTQSFPIPVKEAPEKLIYVGKGAVAKYGVGNAVETLLEANKMSSGWHQGVKYRFKCLPEPDGQPDYYTDGTRDYQTRNGWVGPVAVDVTDLAHRPRGGGWSDNTGVNSGVTSGGKGFFLFSDGDAELIGWRVANVHGGSSGDGKEGVRKDGNTYGNLAMIDVQIDNCDQGFESGPIHGNIYMKRVVIRRCGGASVGSGLTHNVYCGSVGSILVEDGFFGEALWGHLFKSRAKKTTVRNSRFLDTASTAAACPLDICNFGDVTLENNFIQKGPMAANPSAINLGAEGSNADLNLARINNNTIVLGSQSYGGNYGQCVAVMHYVLPRINNGPVSKIVGDGNKVWLGPLNALTAFDTVSYFDQQPVPTDATVLTNTTTLTVPPVMDLTNPTTGKLFEMMTLRPYRHQQILESRQPYPDFNGRLQEMSTLQPRVAANAAPGTVVFTGRATSDISYFGPTTPEKFGPGTTYAFSKDGVYGHSGNPDPWAPDGKFGLTTRPDGTYDVTYQGGLQPGGYYIRIVGTSPADGLRTDQRFLIIVGQ